MFKAVLLDLDGTLLNIDMDYFLKQYFGKMVELAAKMGFKEGNRLVDQVWRSTEVMIADLDPKSSNEEVFMRDFCQNWPYSLEEIKFFFERYYQEYFPRLKDFCSPFPGIPEMVKYIMRKDLKVVIATNAVFPMSALQDRIRWAGLGKHDFELVTSYELMHFCKPHVQYYEEIAERIGVQPEDCLMIGNDTGEDLPASKIGMKTFLVEDMLIDKGLSHPPDWRGKLPDLFDFVRKNL
ncbi:MAG: HAD family hydrolase [Syntrophomonadaceae bacterium]|nr:HAD family hydrolase [Syntrophomonadaceae bacterium]MDD3898654.1 HAD family hydrolase [Syntrophomonadaceae bacterium]